MKFDDEFAALLARLGRFDEAQSELAALRSKPVLAHSAALAVWLCLADGMLEHLAVVGACEAELGDVADADHSHERRDHGFERPRAIRALVFQPHRRGTFQVHQQVREGETIVPQTKFLLALKSKDRILQPISGSFEFDIY